MNPKILLCTILMAALVGIVFWQSRKPNVSTLIPTGTPTPSPSTTSKSPIRTVSFVGVEYAYATIQAKPPDISLIANYTAKREFNGLLQASSCVAGTNAGFYDQEYRPLGLVVVDGSTVHPALTSNLFNGFFAVFGDGTAGISSGIPQSPRIALQSGPVLIQNSSVKSLEINNDEFARRIAVGITNNQNVIFMIVYNVDSVYEGPELKDLPAIVSLVAVKEGYTLISALNLDGGTASAFLSKDVTLSELKTVGSAFCIRKVVL